MVGLKSINWQPQNGEGEKKCPPAGTTSSNPTASRWDLMTASTAIFNWFYCIKRQIQQTRTRSPVRAGGLGSVPFVQGKIINFTGVSPLCLGNRLFLSAPLIKKKTKNNPPQNKPVRCLGGFDSLVKCHLCWPMVATIQFSFGVFFSSSFCLSFFSGTSSINPL